jgi:hypothetical protein
VGSRKPAWSGGCRRAHRHLSRRRAAVDECRRNDRSIESIDGGAATRQMAMRTPAAT